MLQVQNLSFRYTEDSNPLWEGVSFEVSKGELVVIKGVNGSGKTTLLHSICGIIPTYINGILTGNVLLNGEDISQNSLKENAQKINMLFQEPDKQIFMPIVEEEIAFGLESHLVPSDQMKEKIDHSLSLLHIEPLRKSKTSILSFGQKKLVACASILALSPQVFLIDEFSAGMEHRVVTLFSEICRSLKQEGKILVLTDHNPVILDLADRIINLDEL